MSAGVLVVGAGFLGSHIAGAFEATGAPTTVLTRSEPSRAVRRRLGRSHVVVGEASDPRLLVDALDGVDRVVWAAGGMLPADSAGDPAGDAAQSLLPLLHTLEAVRAASGTSITFLSSGGTVYGDPAVLPVPETHPLAPRSPYGAAKAAAEHYLGVFRHLHGVTTLVLRCSNIYGPGQPSDRSQGLVAAALARARAGRAIPVYGDGTSLRDYLYVDDAVRVIVALAGRTDVPDVLNVGSGEGASVLQVLETIVRVTGLDVRPDLRPARGTDIARVVLDISRLRATMPFSPMSLADGVGRTYASDGRAAPVGRVAAR